jgi:FKBP-type peptidyl-prolyl cis-trans isomerase
MQTLFFTVFAAAILICTGCETKLNTNKKRESYVLGQQIGGSLQNQGQKEIDPDILALAIKDFLEGKPSRLKSEEARQTMMVLEQEAKGRVASFLEKNKHIQGVKTTSSGLQYIIVNEGKGVSPKSTSTIKVHYRGYLMNGAQFDSSYDRGQPSEFVVNTVIKGWQEALLMMKPGAKYKLFIPPDLGYGMIAKPGIPPDSLLIFDVELIEIKK